MNSTAAFVALIGLSTAVYTVLVDLTGGVRERLSVFASCFALTMVGVLQM